MPLPIEIVAELARARRRRTQEFLSLCVGAPILIPLLIWICRAVAAWLKQLEYLISGTNNQSETIMFSATFFSIMAYSCYLTGFFDFQPEIFSSDLANAIVWDQSYQIKNILDCLPGATQQDQLYELQQKINNPVSLFLEFLEIKDSLASLPDTRKLEDQYSALAEKIVAAKAVKIIYYIDKFKTGKIENINEFNRYAFMPPVFNEETAPLPWLKTYFKKDFSDSINKLMLNSIIPSFTPSKHMTLDSIQTRKCQKLADKLQKIYPESNRKFVVA